MKGFESKVTRANSIIYRNYLRFEALRNGNFVVVGYPKSGTTWLTRLVAAILSYRYTQNRVRFRFRGGVLHTHYLGFTGKENILYIVRDPREVVCSAKRSLDEMGLSNSYKYDVSSMDVNFSEHVLGGFPGSPVDWRTHLETALKKRWAIVRYEDLVIDTHSALSAALSDCKATSESSINDAIEANRFSLLKNSLSDQGFYNEAGIETWRTQMPKASIDYVEKKYLYDCPFYRV